MKVVSIGRRSSNEVVIRDPLVSREQHCLITEENGIHYIFDANSTNGTYVNGSRIPNGTKMRLHSTDVVRIGNTVLPWQSYFKTSTPPPRGGSSTIGVSGGSSGYSGSDDDDKPQQPTTTALQAIALVLSLAGLGCIIYVFIKVMRWSLFAFISSSNTAIGYMGVGFSLIALILSKIADYKEKRDETTMASIAEWISSTCLCAVVAFIIILYVNPNFFNPFR